MRLRFLTMVGIALAVLALPREDLSAQTERESPSDRAPVVSLQPGSRASSPVVVSAAPSPLAQGDDRKVPDVFLLPDSKGNMRKVLGYPYEDFVKDRKQHLGVGEANTQPRYTIQSVDITGTEKDSRAELSVELTVRLNVDRWVGIPIHLAEAVLVQGPKSTPFSSENPSPAKRLDSLSKKQVDLFLEHQSEDRGYVLWLRSQANTEHAFSLSMLVPLKKEGNDSILRLHLPRATTTRFTMEVVASPVEASVPDGVMVLSTKPTSSGGTRLEMTGSGHPFELRWKKKWQKRDVSDSPVLQVASKILATMDGPEIETESELTVQSLGSSFDSLKIELPKNTEWIPSSQEEVSIQSVSGQQGNRRILEVEFPEKTKGPVSFRIKTRSTSDSLDNGHPLELSGVLVQNAVQQTGYLAVRVEGDWNVLWPSKGRSSQHIRQVEVQKLPESLRAGEPHFAFEYFRVPYRLPAQIIEQKAHLRVDPEYVIRVGAHRADLEANFRYLVSGSKVFEIEFEPAGWILDSIGPPTLVDSFVLDPNSHRVHVRLRQSARGEIPIQIQAHLDYLESQLPSSTPSGPTGDPPGPLGAPSEPTGPRSNGPRTLNPPESSGASVQDSEPSPGSQDQNRLVQFPFPVPLADARTPGVLAIVPENNVILIPQNTETSGLVSQTALLRRLRLPPRQQEPLIYRLESESAIFSAQRTIHPRSVRTAVFSRISLDQKAAHVTQVLRYHVEYEPLDRLTLRLPRNLPDADRVEAIYDGERLPVLSKVNDEQGDDLDTAQIVLPGARIGRFRLELRYSLAIPYPKDQEAIPVTIPFIQPTDGILTESEVEISQNNTQQITLRGEPDAAPIWEKVSSVQIASRENNVFRVRIIAPDSDPAQALPLQLKTIAPMRPSSAYVDRYWVQSYLSKTRRRDQVVMRLVTARHEVQVRFPQPVDLAQGLGQIDLFLNGKSIDRQTLRQSPEDPHLVQIPLPPSNLGVYQLECHYGMAEGFHSPLSSPARLVDQAVARPIYWQLVLPSHIHLLTQGEAYVSENLWRWNGLGWSREPTLSQERLDRWASAIPKSPLPARSNVYLFSSAEPSLPLRVRTTTRATLVLLGSGATLLLGCLVVYTPVLRKPEVLGGAAVLILLLAMLFPEPTLLFGQAIALGVVLALGAAVLRNLLTRRSSRQILVSGSSSVSIPQDATVTYRDLSEEAPSSTTATSITSSSSPPS